MEQIETLLKEYETLMGGRHVEARRFVNAWKLGLLDFDGGGDLNDEALDVESPSSPVSPPPPPLDPLKSTKLFGLATRIQILIAHMFKTFKHVPTSFPDTEFPLTPANMLHVVWGDYGPFSAQYLLLETMYIMVAIVLSALEWEYRQFFCGLFWISVLQSIQSALDIEDWETVDLEDAWTRLQTTPVHVETAVYLIQRLKWCGFDSLVTQLDVIEPSVNARTQTVMRFWWSHLRAIPVAGDPPLYQLFGHGATQLVQKTTTTFTQAVQKMKMAEFDQANPVEITELSGGVGGLVEAPRQNVFEQFMNTVYMWLAHLNYLLQPPRRTSMDVDERFGLSRTPAPATKAPTPKPAPAPRKLQTPTPKRAQTPAPVQRKLQTPAPVPAPVPAPTQPVSNQAQPRQSTVPKPAQVLNQAQPQSKKSSKCGFAFNTILAIGRTIVNYWFLLIPAFVAVYAYIYGVPTNQYFLDALNRFRPVDESGNTINYRILDRMVARLKDLGSLYKEYGEEFITTILKPDPELADTLLDSNAFDDVGVINALHEYNFKMKKWCEHEATRVTGQRTNPYSSIHIQCDTDIDYDILLSQTVKQYELRFRITKKIIEELKDHASTDPLKDQLINLGKCTRVDEATKEAHLPPPDPSGVKISLAHNTFIIDDLVCSINPNLQTDLEEDDSYHLRDHDLERVNERNYPGTNSLYKNVSGFIHFTGSETMNIFEAFWEDFIQTSLSDMT